MAYQIEEAMSTGQLENDIFRYLPREGQILLDNFINEIGYERREEEPRRREEEAVYRRHGESNKADANPRRNSQADGRTDRRETSQDIAKLRFSTREAVKAENEASGMRFSASKSTEEFNRIRKRAN